MLSGFLRLSLLWKILLATSIAVTVLFGIVGWIVQDTTVRAMSDSVDQEVRASFQAYDSLWRSRADTLAAISLVISRMSDVRAAFGTGDAATIRDTAGELWTAISSHDAIFLVADPQGRVLASLGGKLENDLARDLPVVRQAASQFPKQAAGFMLAGGRFYQIAVTPIYVDAGSQPALLNVLVAGYAVDQDVAASLKSSTGGSDFCFESGGTIEASTLPQGSCKNLPPAAAADARLERVNIAQIPHTMLRTSLSDVAGQPIGELRIFRSLAHAQEGVAVLRTQIIVIWLLSVVAGLAITYRLARRILRPVGELDHAAAEVARGNYDYRVPVDSAGARQDELGRLGEAFNQMCASIQEGRRELIRQERISTIGRMSTALVHDLRNPLASIYAGVEMMARGRLSNDQVQRLSKNIHQSSRRIQHLLQELVEAGRKGTEEKELCHLGDVIRSACEAYAAAAEAQSVEISVQVPQDLELHSQSARLERVFLNLIDNALAAMPDGGLLTITAEQQDRQVLIRVQDSGPGIAPSVRPQLFHPFATEGKATGVGLGLAFSHQTVVDHNGQIWADPDEGRGACFNIRLPLE